MSQSKVKEEVQNDVRLTLVVPVLNESEYTCNLIKNLEDATDVSYELIVIDNGSTDETSKRLEEYAEIYEKKDSKIQNFEVITNESNEGISKPWNKGLRAARGEFIAFLNNDIVLPEKWASSLIECLELNENVWCVCPNFTRLEMQDDWEDRVERYSKEKLSYEPIEPPGRIGGFTGFCFMLKTKELRDEIGEFDEDFTFWFTDTDLWQRLKLANRPAVRVSNVLIHHFESKTLVKIPNIEVKINEDAKRFERKWRMREKVIEKTRRKFSVGIMLALPSRGEVDIVWATHMLHLMQRIPVGLGVAVRYTRRQEVDVARTFLVEEALSGNVKYIFFIDDDTFVPLNCIGRMTMESPKEVKTGVVWSKTDPSLPCIFKEEAIGAFIDWIPGRMYSIRRGGLACCLIETDIFRDIPKPWFQMGYSYQTPEGSEVRVRAGEDFYFYDKVVKEGYTPWVDTRIRCDHVDFATDISYPQDDLLKKLLMTERLEKEKNMNLDTLCKKEDLDLYSRKMAIEEYIEELQREVKDIDIKIIKS